MNAPIHVSSKIYPILERYLKPWAYDYSGGNIVYVLRGNVEFIKGKLEENGIKAQVKKM